MNSMLNQGQVTAQDSGQATGQPQPAAKSEPLFHAIQELEVPPGAAWIRLAVRDPLNNRTGTLEVRLPLKSEPTTASATPADKPTSAATASASN